METPEGERFAQWNNNYYTSQIQDIYVSGFHLIPFPERVSLENQESKQKNT